MRYQESLLAADTVFSTILGAPRLHVRPAA